MNWQLTVYFAHTPRVITEVYDRDPSSDARIWCAGAGVHYQDGVYTYVPAASIDRVEVRQVVAGH